MFSGAGFARWRGGEGYGLVGFIVRVSPFQGWFVDRLRSGHGLWPQTGYEKPSREISLGGGQQPKGNFQGLAEAPEVWDQL